MGRYDFSPQRVHRSVTRLIGAGRTSIHPPWYSSIETYPPSERLVRPALQAGKAKKGRASRMFKPIKITYPEDKLRETFFGDHPWELARPRTVLENDGKDYQRQDWDRIDHIDRPLDGESVVQRQVWLMENRGMSKGEAYDKARKEFYAKREREEVMRRIAREEALYAGAEFGKSVLEVGMELEDKAFEEWKAWAENEVVTMRQVQGSVYSGTDVTESDLDTEEHNMLEEADSETAEGSTEGEQTKPQSRSSEQLL
ncbi:mitochondrial ribosomal protein [Myriangium duriaei CBS 260.36]|uniref:Small ribosomal subunit protein mS23 n=1 Tax=Myriangium duriaei CBS 260.36 TaxID=1168546 RepID=A0A9P4IXA7_9PEZI|nr:mitochondrial ribosomal protein [Myriangium duriaei CBS 260.36]